MILDMMNRYLFYKGLQSRGQSYFALKQFFRKKLNIYNRIKVSLVLGSVLLD